MEKRYKTRQRAEVLACLRESETECLSVKELRERLAARGTPVGETTAYRTLTLLCEEGEARRYTTDTDGATFQYAPHKDACNSHFHLKCKDCGKLIHTDCSLLETLETHIETEHNFRMDKTSTVLYGTCETCQRNCKK